MVAVYDIQYCPIALDGALCLIVLLLELGVRVDDFRYQAHGHVSSSERFAVFVVSVHDY